MQLRTCSLLSRNHAINLVCDLCRLYRSTANHNQDYEFH